MTRRERYRRVLEWFSREMPEPKTELSYDTPFHLLLAVILSAQCTGKRVTRGQEEHGGFLRGGPR